MIDRIKKELLDYAEGLDINIEDLSTARWDRNIYGVEPQLAVGDWDYDENEYWGKQLEIMAEIIKKDGLCEYATLADDEDLDGEMTLEYSCWLESLASDILKQY